LRFQLNPGNGALFPWLTAVASAYQEYEINGMLVELVTEASEVSTNLAMGVMAMAAEYNPLAATPSNKQEMLELEYADVTKASHSLIMPIECSRVNDAETHLFIALNDDYLGTDARTFDLASIFIATVGQPAENAKIAEIWVTYEVLLYKPRLPHAIGIPGAHAQVFMATVDQPFANFDLQPGSNLGVRSPPGSGDILYLPQGIGDHWFVSCSWQGDVGTTAIPVPVYVDCTPLDVFGTFAGGNDAANFYSLDSPTSASPSGLVYLNVVKVTGPNPSVGYEAIGIIGNSVGDVWVFPVPGVLVTGGVRPHTHAQQISRMKAKPPKRKIEMPAREHKEIVHDDLQSEEMLFEQFKRWTLMQEKMLSPTPRDRRSTGSNHTTVD